MKQKRINGTTLQAIDKAILNCENQAIEFKHIRIDNEIEENQWNDTPSN